MVLHQLENQWFSVELHDLTSSNHDLPYAFISFYTSQPFIYRGSVGIRSGVVDYALNYDLR